MEGVPSLHLLERALCKAFFPPLRTRVLSRSLRNTAFTKFYRKCPSLEALLEQPRI